MAILIVGGNKGIGAATALRFAEPGKVIFINGHADVERAAATKAAVEAKGATCHVVMGDVSSPEGARGLIARVAELTEHIDVLVHSAVRPLTGSLLELSAEDVSHAVQTGGLSVLYVVRAAVDLLAPGGSVVFISSIGGHRVVPAYGPIGVSKATAEALIRYLAVELSERGIRANTVSSGPVDTDAYRSAFEDADERLALAASRNPAHRPQTVEDVANLIFALCGPDTEMVQGQHVRVDGGLYL